MKTSVEELSAVQRKLSVVIAADEINQRLAATYRDLARSAKIPGFRPNKIPRRILEARFGQEVAEDLARTLIQETFAPALEETGLKPVSPPHIEKEPLQAEKDFAYTAEVEVVPPFEVPNYLGIEVRKERLAVTDDDVAQRMEEIRNSRGNLIDITEDRPLAQDDLALLAYEGFENDVALEGVKTDNYMVRVGSHSFHPVFEEGLIGLRKGDSKDITVTFEGQQHMPRLAGKTIRFHVTLKEIKVLDLPALDDEFARGLDESLTNLEDLKVKVREALTNEQKGRIAGETKARLLDKITAGLEFELPPYLVQAETDQAVQNFVQNLARSGADPGNVPELMQKLESDFQPAAAKRIRQMLVLKAIAQQENIAVEEEDLNRRFAQMGAAYGQDADTVRRFYQENEEVMASMQSRVLEEKTLDYLLEKAVVTEVDPTELIPPQNTDKEPS